MLEQLKDVQNNRYWAQRADEINARWARIFNRQQQGISDGIKDYGSLAEDMMVLGEIIADLSQQLAEYYKWRAS